MWVEGGFEAAHERNIGASDRRKRRRKMPAGSRRYKIMAPNIDLAFELSRAPREKSGGVFGSAERKDARGGFAEALERGGIARVGKESKVEHPAGPCESGVRERSLVSKRAQLLEKCDEASRES